LCSSASRIRHEYGLPLPQYKVMAMRGL